MNLHAQLTRSGLTHEALAERLSSARGVSITRQSVQRWFAQEAGVPMDWIPHLLSVLEIETAPKGALIVPPEHADYVRSSVKLAQTFAARHHDELFISPSAVKAVAV